MKAAVVHSFDQASAGRGGAQPQAGPGQVVVKIETCGLCHTDIHAAHGDWPVKPTPPFIPGHEGVGIVERWEPASTAWPRGTGWRSPGSAMPAGRASTARPGARPFVRASG